MAKSPDRKSTIGFRATASQKQAIAEVARAAKVSEGEVLRACAPDPVLTPALVAMASSPQGFEASYRALVVSGLLARLEAAGLDSRLTQEIGGAIRAGRWDYIARVASEVIRAQGKDGMELVRVEGGDGIAPVPAGGKAAMVDGDIEVTFEHTRPVLEFPMMIAMLRSNDPNRRLAGAEALAVAVGAGLRESGADRLDVEHCVGADVAALLERAVEGDTEAIDELEKSLTNNPAAAGGTPIEGAQRSKKA